MNLNFLPLKIAHFSSAALSYPTLCDPMDRGSLEGYSSQLSDKRTSREGFYAQRMKSTNMSYAVLSTLSVRISHSVMSDSLWPHGLQHARLPCPSTTSGVYLNSCPLSQWCLPTSSSSVVPFSSCPQSFPASGSFQMSQFFASGNQRIQVSASASVLPVNI